MSNDILDDFSPFSPPFKQALQKHIDKGKIILWAERPKQGVLFRSSDGCLIPFSLAWGGFAIFWETMVFVMDAPIFMALFGIPFVVTGLYLIVGRFFHDMYIRKQVIYGLTEKQIIIKRAETLRFVELSALTDIQLTKKRMVLDLSCLTTNMIKEIRRVILLTLVFRLLVCDLVLKPFLMYNLFTIK